MSVLVKGMKMPETCRDCPFCLSYSDTDNDELKNWGHCTVTGLEADLDDVCGECWGCPLVELPSKHGRLVDADALARKLKNENEEDLKQLPHGSIERLVAGMLQAVLIDALSEENAPTVLEAEGEEYDA